jgi:hypothetical protein
MTGLGHADPGPGCANLTPDLRQENSRALCRALGIEPGDTWVLEVSHEGVLQFTRPLTEAERSRLLRPATDEQK